MAEKDKAKELVEKFKDLVCIDYMGDEEPIFELQKQCALILVDELIKENKYVHNNEFIVEYWQQVKTEIEAL